MQDRLQELGIKYGGQEHGDRYHKAQGHDCVEHAVFDRLEKDGVHEGFIVFKAHKDVYKRQIIYWKRPWKE